MPFRVAGDAAFFARAEVRDLLAWLRMLADPFDAAAVVRALTRPPIDLRSADLARVTTIARRRKLDMVSALDAALESPQLRPEARDRIQAFLKLQRSAATAMEAMRPDVFVRRLIERVGMRRHRLFAATPETAERLVNLSRLAELAADWSRRVPRGSVRDFVRHIAAVAEAGEVGAEDADPPAPGAVMLAEPAQVKGLEFDAVYLLGLHAGSMRLAPWEDRWVPGRARHGEPARGGRRPDRRAPGAPRLPRGEPRRALGRPQLARGGRPRGCEPGAVLRGRSGCARRERGGAGRGGVRPGRRPSRHLPHDQGRGARVVVAGRLGAVGDAPGHGRGPERGGRALSRVDQARLAPPASRARGRARGPGSRERADRQGRLARAARRPGDVGSRRLRPRRGEGSRGPPDGDRGAARAVARAVHPAARRRTGALGVGHRPLPDVPAQVQVRARLRDPAGAHDQPAVRDPDPQRPRALPFRGDALAWRRRCRRRSARQPRPLARVARGRVEADRLRRVRRRASVPRPGRRRARALPRAPPPRGVRAGLARAELLVRDRRSPPAEGGSTGWTSAPTALTS